MTGEGEGIVHRRVEEPGRVRMSGVRGGRRADRPVVRRAGMPYTVAAGVPRRVDPSSGTRVLDPGVRTDRAIAATVAHRSASRPGGRVRHGHRDSGFGEGALLFGAALLMLALLLSTIGLTVSVM